MPTSVSVCVCAALVSGQIKSEELAKTLASEASSVPHAHISYTLLMEGYLRTVLVCYVPAQGGTCNSLGNSSEI